MKVEKKAVRSGILKLEKNVQITLDEDMNVPDTRPDVEKIIESRGEVHIDEIEVLQIVCACGETSSCRYCI